MIAILRRARRTTSTNPSFATLGSKILLLLLLALSLSGSAAQAQVDVTATAGTTGPVTYATLKLAFDAVNAGTHQGDITMSITANTVEGVTPATLNSSGAGSALYTSVLIRPTVDGVSVSGNPVTGFGVLQLKGADNVTIDGDNPNTGGINRNLTVQNTAAATVIANSAIRIATSAAVTSADNITIRNCNLLGNVTSGNAAAITSTTGSSNSSFGIYAGGNGGATAIDAPTAITSVTTNTAPSGTTINNLLVTNNAISSTARAIVFNGAAASVSTGVTVTNNVIGDQGAPSPATPPYTSPSTTVYTKGIWVAGTGAVTVTGNIINNLMSYVGTPITTVELASAIGPSVTISNNTITNIAENGSSGAVKPILISSSTGTYTVSGNIIANVQAMSSSSGTAGIEVGGTVTSGLVELNKISTVYNRSAGTFGATGLNVAAGTAVTVRNNFISGVNMNMAGGGAFSTTFGLHGLKISGGTGHKVYHNSVNLFGSLLGAANSSILSSAFTVVGTGQTGMDVRNNAFQNILTGGTTSIAHVAAYLPTAGTSAMNLTLNNNVYYYGQDVARQGVGQAGTTAGTNFFITLTAFKAYSSTLSVAATNDNSSIATSFPAPFTSSSDLHIPPATLTQLESGGAAIGVGTDIDGDARNATTPDIGADEFTGVAGDPEPPLIVYTPLTNTVLTTNRTLSTTITDTTGVPTAGAGLPVIYYRKGVSGAYAANACVFIAGSAYDCTVDYALVTGGSVTGGDVIQYYVAAQDITNNVSTNPLTGAGGFTANPPAAATPPTTPASYLIQVNISGPLTVGTGGNYTSLTNPGGLFEAINANIITGNLIVDILNDLTTETGAVALNQWTETGVGGYTLLVRPSGAPRSITGTSVGNTGLITLNGADRVTFDGSTSGGTDRSLTITNLGTTGVVFWLRSAGALNGSTDNTVKNCLISGNSGTTTIAGVLAGGTAFGSAAEAQNSNNTIQNNVITKVQNALYLSGNVAALDQNWNVLGNTFGSTVVADKLGFRGMLIGSAQSFTISANTIAGVISTPTSSSTMNGIQVAFANNGGTISRNSISDIKQTNTAGWGSAGITLGSTNTTANITVANNMIRDVASQGFADVTELDNGYGIVVLAGGGYNIYANTVLLTTDQVVAGGNTAAVNVVAAVTFPGAVNLRDNILGSIQTIGTRYGVLSSAPATVFANIDYNDYFAQNVGFIGGSARATLANWQTATGQDGNSLAVDPIVVSPADLHLQGASPLRAAGTPLAAVTVDFDNDPRSPVTPDIGADEIRQVNLSITKDDSAATEVPGTSVTYTIVAANAGPYDALGVTVADTFPAALLGCSTTCVASPGSSCTAVAVLGNLSDTANLLVGGSVTYTAVCNVATDATGTLANTATVAAASNAFDPNNGDNSATDSDTLTPEADLAITKTDGVTVATAGGSVTYTIVASNAGPSAAPGSNVTDNFPAACTLVSWTCLGSGSGTCTAGGSGNINDSVNLPVGGSVTYTAACSIDGSATGSLVNTATVAVAGGVTDPVSGNNSATDTDTIAPQADLSITKTDGVTVASPGTNTTYTIVAANAGPSSAPTAAVIDIFPAACTSANWTCSGLGGGTCALSGSGNINQSVNLPSGGSVTFIAVCAISPAATGTLSNTATIGVGVNDPNTANNSATDVDTLSNEIFVDGFETGDTSQWSATVPPIFEVYATFGVATGGSVAAFGYDFAAVQSGEALAPTAIAFVTDVTGKPLFLIGARRTDPNGQLELTLEIVGGGRSSWVPVGEVGQQVQLEWAAADQSNLGHVAVSLDGRLALWVEDYAGSATPAGVKLLRAPAPVAP